MKKSFLFFLISFIFIIPCLSQNETLTITTYYPAPYGVYNELRMFPHAPATVTCNDANPNNEGYMFYDSTPATRGLYVCSWNGAQLAWQSATGYWAIDVNNDIHNTNTGNVNIMRNLQVPTTTNVGGNIFGVIYSGANPFIHNLGTDNTLVGVNAGNLTMAGDGNTAVGSRALTAITAAGARLNTAVGVDTLIANFNTSGNTAVGYSALRANTGAINTAVGLEALRNNGSGSQNVAIGDNALQNNTTGQYNIAIGTQAFRAITAGIGNSGNDNIAIGSTSLERNTTGYSNIALGSWALNNNSTGYNNTSLGFEAGYSNTTGHDNVFLGYEAGYNETSSNRLYIANSSTATPLIYGDFTAGSESVTLNVKNFYIKTLPSAAAANIVYYDSTNGRLSYGLPPSSKRYKHDIRIYEMDLNKIKKLKPVKFKWNKNTATPNKEDFGLIAEDVYKVFPELVALGPKGTVESVDYAKLSVILLKAVQEQQKEIEDLKAKINHKQ